MVSFDFSDRIAVLTGAGGGLGFTITNQILDSGGSIEMIDVKPEPESFGGDTTRRIFAQGDLSNQSFVTATIDAGVKRFGRIDYLANVTGVLWIDRDASLLEMDLDVWDQVFDINLKSMVYTALAAVPHMREQRIVHR